MFDVLTDGRFVTNDLRTMVSAAEQGVGLLHVIEDYVRVPLDEGRLVPGARAVVSIVSRLPSL